MGEKDLQIYKLILFIYQMQSYRLSKIHFRVKLYTSSLFLLLTSWRTIMNSKLTKYTFFILLTTISLNCLASNKMKGFQVAVIRDSSGAKEILKGKYRLGLDKLAQHSSKKNSSFDSLLARCAARIMTRELKQAHLVCTDAIESYKNHKEPKYKYLKSMAYSNRGIARFLLGDIIGASNDLEIASSINKNKIVLSNLSNLQSQISNHEDNFIDRKE